MVFLSTIGTGGVESVLKLIGLILLCIIIIAASYYTTKFVGNRQAGMTGESNFKSLDIYRLNQNKYLQLIEVGRRYFVIAVSKDSVQFIAELEKDDITYWRTEKKVSFKDIMSKVVPGRKDSEDRDDPSVENEVSEGNETEHSDETEQS